MEPNKFKINDLVWGKLGGYEYWPAQIIDPKTKNEEEKPDEYCVQFIASKTYTFLSEKNLWDYKENKERYTKGVKYVKKCPQAYKKALQLAEEYMETIEMEQLCGSCCVEYVHVAVAPETWRDELTRRLLGLQQSNILTDIVMWDGRGTRLSLHSPVLAACSTFWQNVFRETSSDNYSRTYSTKCSPLDKAVWDVIINFMYTGESDVFDAEDTDPEFLGDVIQQMTSMKLNLLLDCLLHHKENVWRSKLCETLFSFQRDDKLTDLVLVHHSGEKSTDPSCKAHIMLFMAMSDYLRARFAPKAVLGKYTLGVNASPGMWRNLIEFIYTGSTDVACSDVSQMTKIARKLQIPFMVDAIEKAPTIDSPWKDAK